MLKFRNKGNGVYEAYKVDNTPQNESKPAAGVKPKPAPKKPPKPPKKA